MASSIFEAAEAGDVEAVRAYLKGGADLEAKNQFGFTALHCAARACNKKDPSSGLELIRILLDGGASPNALSEDGRSVLYLMAEMSWVLEPIKLLIENGADPNVTDDQGVHIVVNALSDDVKIFLSQVTGHPIPPPPLELKEVKITTSEWRQVKGQLDTIFNEMNRSGLVALQDAGYTQEEAFSICSQQFQIRSGVDAGLTGMCFYTHQDLNRAKRTSLLPLGFWGAPDGNNASTVQVGNRIVEIFKAYGFIVDWSGTAGTRPTVYLQDREIS